jgi:hypothetical protein
MKQSLQERCEAQVRNEAVMRKAAKFEFESVVKLGAMMHVNAGREVDAARIKECGRILKGKAGILSNFRGTLQYIVMVKMALADDPVVYIDDVMGVYDQLKAGRKLPGEMLAMAATTIVENCPAEQRAEVVEKTRETYARLKERHRFLTDDSDMSLIALMVMAGKDPERAADEAEGLFQAMKESYRIGSDVAQSAAMVLALSEKPANQKLEGFFGLYDACKAAKHATSRDKAMVVYSAFADADCDLAEAVAAIGEVDEWLKGNKGYGALGVGASERRLFAASLVLEDLQAASPAAASSMASAVTQAVVEELVLILMMIILTSIIVSANVSNAIG